MGDDVWRQLNLLTLPYGTLATLHTGVSEVCVRENLYTRERRVFKRVSLLGREDTLAVREANLLLSITHPNIAQVFDVAEPTGTDPLLGLVEIVMPYYALGSVFDAIHGRNERFSVGHARDVAVKALRGLAHLHETQRILHRDVKPANLFLSDDRSLVKLGDFGEATPMEADGTSSPLLSPQFWCAPECFVGSRYTVAAEVYAVGMTLAEMLSGPLPYDEYSREQLGERLAGGKCAVKPRHLRPAVHIPSAVRRIVTKATQLDPGSRYPSADAMTTALLDARFTDWNWPAGGDNELEWHGVDWRGRDYRVTARRRRSGGWRAQAERRYPSGWRRIGQVADADASLDAAAAIFAAVDRLR